MRTAYNIFLLALVAMATSLASCVKEDLSKCVTPTTGTTRALKLRFVPRQMDVTPTAEELRTAAVYIFDAAGNVTATWTKENPALNTSYETGIMLGADTYRIVGWLNAVTPFNITPTATRSALMEGKVDMTIPADGNVTGDLPLLLYGSVNQVLAPTTDADIEIPLTRDTYKINLTLSGVPQDGSEYELRIVDNNGAYDFENQFINTATINYLATATAGTGGGEPGTLNMSLTTLRLDEARSPQITIVNKTTGKVVFPQNNQPSVNLMDLIRQTGVNLGTTFNLNLTVDLTSAGGSSVNGTTVEIWINGWHVVIEGNHDVNPYE